jgi:hypothetical protein
LKLRDIAFTCDMRSWTYHTVQQFLRIRDTWWWPCTAETCCEKEGGDNNKLQCRWKYIVWNKKLPQFAEGEPILPVHVIRVELRHSSLSLLLPQLESPLTLLWVWVTTLLLNYCHTKSSSTWVLELCFAWMVEVGCVGFEVLTAVPVKSTVLWVVVPCSSWTAWHFGGIYRLHL